MTTTLPPADLAGAHAARFTLHPVRPPLDRYVAGIWLTRGAVPVAAETVLPNGVVEVILNLGPAHRVVAAGGDRWYRHAWLAGIHQGPLVIASQGWTDLVGIRFRPGGAAALLDVSLRSVTDDVVDLDALGGRDASLARLRDRIAAAGIGERVRLVEEALLLWLDGARRRPDPRVAAAVAAIQDATSVSDLARMVGVSHKHLIDRFRAEVGVPPSRLRRILRFDAVVRAIAGDSAPSWSALAAAYGYADQPHLVREFRTFAGVSPRGFLASRMADQAHLDASAVVVDPEEGRGVAGRGSSQGG